MPTFINRRTVPEELLPTTRTLWASGGRYALNHLSTSTRAAELNLFHLYSALPQREIIILARLELGSYDFIRNHDLKSVEETVKALEAKLNSDVPPV